MRRLELLIEALEQDGHPEIRTKIKSREEIANYKSTLGNILAPEELDVVKKTLDAYEVPTPKSWSNALWIHAMKESIRMFSSVRPYDSTKLYNLITTLREAGLHNPEILMKIIKAAEAIKRYEEGGDPT